MNIEAYRIPQHLDDPERFLFWTMDEAMIILGCFFAGVYFALFIEGMVVGFVSWLIYRKFKQGMSKYDLFGQIYWLFPHKIGQMIPWNRGAPPSKCRFYAG